MKKLMIALGASALMLFFSTTATAQSAGQAIGKTKAQCGNIYHGQGVSWEANVIALGLCVEPTNNEFVIYEVRVVFSCPPQDQILCLPAPPVVVSYVTFDCEGNITVACQ